ncbi:DUF4105 domain-containing protein [Fulvivirga ulvae]|uniref:lipoprotein N-acyltransferase Lnb domain-containing protein n=1 Tax=Fulvivirga ulvae TaxID=2904245 RepID=UPI001F480600|nr:DUF4105 domain-containing protein [Fulvivirga ulvae]UII33475.1 DUF4105 domain-containing protein [Fulvivirga ulvae]
MKNIWLLFILFPLISNSQNLKLSEKADIHILTCGPYQGELYSAFGHSAIRVKDPRKGYDILYNYGVFDFDQPNFYLNFARGHLNYKLGVTEYRNFRDYYIYYNRYIHEQVLNLSHQQKQELFDFLQWNALPENQYYLYDYFYDNCATRVRDALVMAFGDSVQFDGSYINTNYTIRGLTDLYLKQQPWGDLGIDICLGLPMDKVAAPYEYMFLPDYIEKGFNQATIVRAGKRVPLVKKTIVTYDSTLEEDQASVVTPFTLFIILLVIGSMVTYFGFRKGKLYAGFDAILFSVTGLIGWLLLLLWLATDHRAAAGNLNLLWAIPLHFPVALLLIIRKRPLFLKRYFNVIWILSILLLISWAFLPQQLHYALIPFVMLISLRAYYIQRYLSRNETA